MPEKSNDSNENAGVIRDRLNTRESSTLTIVITTFSTSLALLVIPQLSVVLIFGPIISFLGILYREATIFSIDRRDYNRLNK